MQKFWLYCTSPRPLNSYTSKPQEIGCGEIKCSSNGKCQVCHSGAPLASALLESFGLTRFARTHRVVSFSASFDTPDAYVARSSVSPPNTRLSMVCVSVVVRYKIVDQNGLGLNLLQNG